MLSALIWGLLTHALVYFSEGRLKLLPMIMVIVTTPSYVTFCDTEHLIGDAAKKEFARNPNTVFDAKRFIGNRFEGTTVQTEVKNYFSRLSTMPMAIR